MRYFVFFFSRLSYNRQHGIEMSKVYKRQNWIFLLQKPLLCIFYRSRPVSTGSVCMVVNVTWLGHSRTELLDIVSSHNVKLKTTVAVVQYRLQNSNCDWYLTALLRKTSRKIPDVTFFKIFFNKLIWNSSREFPGFFLGVSPETLAVICPGHPARIPQDNFRLKIFYEIFQK